MVMRTLGTPSSVNHPSSHIPTTRTCPSTWSMKSSYAAFPVEKSYQVTFKKYCPEGWWSIRMGWTGRTTITGQGPMEAWCYIEVKCCCPKARVENQRRLEGTLLCVAKVAAARPWMAGANQRSLRAPKWATQSSPNKWGSSRFLQILDISPTSCPMVVL